MAQPGFGKPAPTATSTAATVIGPGLTVEGEITGTESLLIQGTVKGRISVTESVSVDRQGNVEADIEAKDVRVAGIVTGNVSAAEMFELAGEARLVGDVRAGRIKIDPGGVLRGRIDMQG